MQVHRRHDFGKIHRVSYEGLRGTSIEIQNSPSSALQMPRADRDHPLSCFLTYRSSGTPRQKLRNRPARSARLKQEIPRHPSTTLLPNKCHAIQDPAHLKDRNPRLPITHHPTYYPPPRSDSRHSVTESSLVHRLRSWTGYTLRIRTNED